MLILQKCALVLFSILLLFTVEVFTSNDVKSLNATQVQNDKTVGIGFRLRSEEKIALDAIRPMVEDVLYQPHMHGDNFLIKFLRAQDLDVNAAAKMLRKAIDWRKSNKIDETQTEDWTKWENLFPFIISGEDKSHRPLFYLLVSTYDIRKAVLSGQYDTLKRLYDRDFEKSIRVIQNVYDTTRQNAMTEGIMILDLAGFNITQHACAQCRAIFEHAMRAYEEYYPQSLYKLLFINAPQQFEIVLELVRPIMSPHTREALEVYGLDPNKWKPVLEKYIAPDQLLVRYGGTRNLK